MPDKQLELDEVHDLCLGICPDCGQGPILEGPSGGAATNLMCENCKQQFNFGGIVSFRQGVDVTRESLFRKIWDGS
jgi:hypothetical protein